jgi:hypothetical protein
LREEHTTELKIRNQQEKAFEEMGESKIGKEMNVFMTI